MDIIQFKAVVEDIVDRCNTESEIWDVYNTMRDLLFEVAMIRNDKLKTLGIICDE